MLTRQIPGPTNTPYLFDIIGWGARIRTWEWRNQNQLDYSMTSRRIWKNRPKRALAISIAWQPFPNEK
jgi:hypothetical protein